MNNKEEIVLIQIITEKWKTPEGEDRFNIYGLGRDGAVYKKMSDKRRGWIRMCMDVEFQDGENENS